MDDTRYLVWLTSLVGVRSVTVRRLLSHFQTGSGVYKADSEKLKDLPWLKDSEREALREKSLERADMILARCEEKNISILTLRDEDYPERLQEISDPPAVLYIRGRLPLVDELPLVALVGTRRASAYGLKMAEQLGSELAGRGVTVVTGLAKGIDAKAAKAVLLAGGCVVGVLGTAIDEYYPKENKELIDEAAARGAVISEFPPDYPAMPSNFPRRNRIISGLCCGTCVVEAPVRSGALITGNLSVDQGRDLFVVPSAADSVSGRGSNKLLQSCGKLCLSAEDITEEYEALFPGILHAPLKNSSIVKPAAFDENREPEKSKSEVDKEEPISYITLQSRLSDFAPDEKAVLEPLLQGEKQVDEIIISSGLPASKVLSMLTIFSIRGVVKALPGKRYILNLK